MRTTTTAAFSFVQLARMAGTPDATLILNVDKWGIQPSVRERDHVQGKQVQFSFREGFTIIVCDQLRKHGVALDTIKAAARFLLRTDFKARFDKGEQYLVATRTQVFLAREDAVFGTAGDRPAAAVVIDLPLLMIRFTEASGRFPRRDAEGFTKQRLEGSRN